ncbi:hypothetical protein OAC63_04255 [Amylibacter sp.]|nr:hypothetical protein [Amylibacter sp.]
MFKPKIRTVVVALTASLTFAQPADANKLLDWMKCSMDITKEIRPKVTGSGQLKWGKSIDAELYNNHNSLKITSVTVRLSGTYGNGTPFTRKYEEIVKILPGYSAGIYIQTYLNHIDDDWEWKILEIRGCTS